MWDRSPPCPVGIKDQKLGGKDPIQGADISQTGDSESKYICVLVSHPGFGLAASWISSSGATQDRKPI